MLESLTRSTGLLCVVSGPSGVGKDTVLDSLIARNVRVTKCVTATTRYPRPDERNGIDYIFMSPDEFSCKVKSGMFLEYANVHGNMYGTLTSEVDELTSQGLDVILKIDVQGARNVKIVYPDALMIFILPPSMDELEKRLRNRKTDTEESIQSRLHNAAMEIQSVRDYDYAVVNDIIENSVRNIEAILIAEHHRIKK